MPKTTESRNKNAISQETDFLGTAIGAFSYDLPDIVEFATHEKLLDKKLYPRQKTLLRLIYGDTEHMTEYDYAVVEEWTKNFYQGTDRIGVAPDVMDRIAWLKRDGRAHFKEIENISGRRGSKGVIGATLAGYQVYKLIKLDDPQAHYGVERGKELYCYVTATTRTQAQAYQFSDIQRSIETGPCFEPYLSASKPTFMTLWTPADKRRIAEWQTRGVTLDRDMASIHIIAESANSSASRGGAAFMNIFDEMAHMILGTEGPRTADAVYKALMPSLDQLGKDGMAYIPTSPLTKAGKAYAVYQDGLAIEELKDQESGELYKAPAYPWVFVIQLPSWEVYEDWRDPVVCGGVAFDTAPLLYEEVALEEARDPYTFRVERKAQWAEVIDAYLPAKQVDRIFKPWTIRDKNGNESIRDVPEKKEAGAMRWIYRGHGDPSKSGANFAVAFGHAEPFLDEDGEEWTHVIIDWMHVWKPVDFPDHEVDYAMIEKTIAKQILKFPAMQLFSYDQYGGFITVPQMKKRLRKAGSRTRVKEIIFSESSNKRRNEVFKTAISMGWVHAYEDEYGPEDQDECLLSLELKFLQERNGRVDCPSIGPVTTKDLADCVMVVSESLLGEQYERLRTRERLGSTPILSGAQGGYHTDPEVVTESESGEMSSAARDRLQSFGSGYGNRARGYGNLPARRDRR